MAKFAYYFSDYRGKEKRAHDNLRFFADALMRHGQFFGVFRYQFDFLKNNPRFSDLQLYYLYDHLPKLAGEQVSLIESKYCIPFSTLRIMTNVSRVRYPDVSKLPSDMEFAQIAASWVKFFREKKPDVFITGLMDDYAGIIGMEVARAMGVKTAVIFSGGVFSGQYMLCDINYLPVFYGKYPKAEIEAAKKKSADGLTRIKLLNPVVAKYSQPWFDLTRLGGMPMMAWAFLSSFRAYYFGIPPIERKMWFSTFELVRRQVNYFIRSRVSRFYFDQEPKEGERFVFFPLHFTDDAAIVTAVPFANQIQIAEELAKVLPHGVKLYIKPHPHWKCADLKIADMGRLKKIPNAVLIKYGVNAKDLIRKSEFVVIINSSVGYECLAMKKKVYTLGNFYPKDIIPRIASPRDLPFALGAKFDWERVDEYMALNYLHGIYCREELYAFGSFDAEVAGRLAEAIDRFRQFEPKK